MSRSISRRSVLATSGISAAALALAACGSSDDGKQAGGSGSAEGVLKVGVEGVYKPYNFHDDSGKLVGFEIDIVEAIAEKIGKKAEELKKALVVSWEKLPGKSERWLMTTIRDNTTMFFGGKDTPAAFVNFKILGSLGRENCEILNEEFLTDVSQVLGIQKERIFVAHDECPSWGWVKN